MITCFPFVWGSMGDTEVRYRVVWPVGKVALVRIVVE